MFCKYPGDFISGVKLGNGENNMNKIYTDACEIKEKILEDYYNEEVELNALFFNFNVRIVEKELIELYASIQSIINGDSVMRLIDPEIEKTGENQSNIWGTEADLIPEGEYEDVYEGNCKDFLERFNDKELETGICRVMDVKRKGDIIGGNKLDFIW